MLFFLLYFYYSGSKHKQKLYFFPDPQNPDKEQNLRTFDTINESTDFLSNVRSYNYKINEANNEYSDWFGGNQ